MMMMTMTMMMIALLMSFICARPVVQYSSVQGFDAIVRIRGIGSMIVPANQARL
jgi:hypothetical protein